MTYKYCLYKCQLYNRKNLTNFKLILYLKLLSRLRFKIWLKRHEKNISLTSLGAETLVNYAIFSIATRN